MNIAQDEVEGFDRHALRGRLAVREGGDVETLREYARKRTAENRIVFNEQEARKRACLEKALR